MGTRFCAPASAGSSSFRRFIGRWNSEKCRSRLPSNRLSVAKWVEPLEERRLFSGGTLDTTYGVSGVNSTSVADAEALNHSIAIQSNGETVEVCGKYNSSTNYDFDVVRWNTSGSLDTSFGSSGSVVTDFSGQADVAQAVAIQSDQKIVVAGYANWTTGGVSQQGIALERLDTDGSLDTSFGSGGKVTLGVTGGYAMADSIVIQSNGQIVVGGDASNKFLVARFNSNGSVDTTYGSGGYTITSLSSLGSVIYGIALDAGGNVVAVGSAAQSNGNSGLGIARYTTSGSLDTSFNGTGYEATVLGVAGNSSSGEDVAIQSNGEIVVVGSAYGLTYSAGVARYNTNGTLDTSFGTSGQTSLNLLGAANVMIQPDSKILIGSGADNELGRLNPNGTLDTGFGTSGIASSSNFGSETSCGLVFDAAGHEVVAGYNSGSSKLFVGRYWLTALPTANAGGPYSVNTQSSVGLDGSSSSDPDGESISYAWDMNYTGTFVSQATGATPTFSAVGISGPATRTVALQVTDLLGAGSALSTATVTINKVPPVVSTSASNYSPNEGTSVNVYSTVSDVDPTDTWTYDWHVTDTTGQVITDGTTQNWAFTPASAGTYTATLTVTDRFGSQSQSQVILSVQHVAPTLSISGPAYASRGDLYTLNLSGTEVGYETISNWTITWGDGDVQTVTGNPSSVSHTFISAGSDTISATATDAYGTYNASSNVTMTVASGIYYDLAQSSGVAYSSVGANPGYMVDGNGSTQWDSGNVSSNPNQWVFVDLGGAYNVNEVKIVWGSSYAGSYKIRISNDSISWFDLTTVQTGSAGTADLGGLNGNARYVMVDLMGLASGKNNYQIQELSVLGSDDLALNRTCYVSNGSSSETNALDTSGSTYWETTGTGNWIFMDLGEVYNINQAKITFAGDYPTNYSICTSCDTVNWTQISPTYTGANGLNIVNGFNGDGRYVLLSLPAAENGSDVKVSDFEVHGSTVLSLNRPVTASSGSSSAANAVDGNLSTAWTSASAGTQYIYTDLGAAYDVTRVTLNFGADYPSAFQIQTSEDASTWNTVYSTTSFAGGELDQGNLFGDGRYVRLYCTAGSFSNYQLDEMSVYGSADLALNRPTTDSTAATGHGAPYAVDMDPTTSWQSTAAGSQWVQVDLGTTYTVTTVNVNWDSNYSNNYNIQISSDGLSWTTLANVTWAHEGNCMSAGLSGTGRYIRLSMSSGVGSYYQVDDFSVFGH